MREFENLIILSNIKRVVKKANVKLRNVFISLRVRSVDGTVKWVLSLRVPQKERNLLTNWVPISFSRITIFYKITFRINYTLGNLKLKLGVFYSADLQGFHMKILLQPNDFTGVKIN